MPHVDSLHNQLREIVSDRGLLPTMQLDHYCVDGFTPKAVLVPSSIQEIQEIFAFSANHGLSIIPAGSGTKLGIGNPPEQVDLVLSTRQMNSVLEYEPADLTVTVQAGMKLRDLQMILGKHGQYLPLNPPYADRTTVGGIAATGSSGPLRLRHGTPRSRILGMRVVQSGGDLVQSGGKVVKNVAGYDLNKLYIGSFGTLGIITDLTFKLFPLPECERVVILRFKEIQDAVRVSSEITNSQLLPSFLNLFINGLPSTNILNPTLVVGIDGAPKTVDWQGNQLHSIAEQNRPIGMECIEKSQSQNLVEAMQAFPEYSQLGPSIVCKANIRATDIEDFITTALEAGHDLGASTRAMALMGSGIMHLTFTAFSSNMENPTIVDTLIKLREHTLQIGGNLIVETAPIELKRDIDIWGPVGKIATIMKQIKARFDPGGLLNPGRFVAGI